MTAKGYWIVHVTVEDAERYKEYVALDTPIVAEYGGRFLARGGAVEVTEGAANERHVIVEFPDMETARACYNSEGYQAAAEIRKATARTDFVIVEGVA